MKLDIKVYARVILLFMLWTLLLVPLAFLIPMVKELPYTTYAPPKEIVITIIMHMH